MADKIYVKATDPDRTGVWDRDPAQINGEVMVAGEKVFEVNKTSGVQRAIAEGRIEAVEKPKPARKAAAKTTTKTPPKTQT